jgi:hypothetical protein
MLAAPTAARRCAPTPRRTSPHSTATSTAAARPPESTPSTPALPLTRLAAYSASCSSLHGLNKRLVGLDIRLPPRPRRGRHPGWPAAATPAQLPPLAVVLLRVRLAVHRGPGCFPRQRVASMAPMLEAFGHATAPWSGRRRRSGCRRRGTATPRRARRRRLRGGAAAG